MNTPSRPADGCLNATHQRPRPVCYICKAEFVSKVNRHRCESTGVSDHPPHSHRQLPVPQTGFFVPPLEVPRCLAAAMQQLCDWWTQLHLDQTSAILHRVTEIGNAIVPSRLLHWVGQKDVMAMDLRDPGAISSAMTSLEVVSDAHRVMAQAGEWLQPAGM